MKIIKKDYPFTIITEEKTSKAGKGYTQISIGYTSIKDKDAKELKDRYKTSWMNFIDATDLLKISNLCEIAYQRWKDTK